MGRRRVATLRGVSSARQLGVTQYSPWPFKPRYRWFGKACRYRNNVTPPQWSWKQHKWTVLKTDHISYSRNLCCLHSFSSQKKKTYTDLNGVHISTTLQWNKYWILFFYVWLLYIPLIPHSIIVCVFTVHDSSLLGQEGPARHLFTLFISFFLL